MAFIGKDVPAQNSPALVAGAGLYTGDVKLDRMTYAHIVRSPYAAAKILSIDASAALELPGVLLVVTGEELRAKDYAMPVEGFGKGASLKPFALYPLAVGRVRYAGEGVAAVVAEDPYTAKQAALLVDVDYEDLDPVVDPERGLAADSPLVEPDWGSNVLFEIRMQAGDAGGLIAKAARTVGGELRHHRYTGAALEPRAYVADYDPHRRTLTFWASTQCPHPMRTLLAQTLHLAENDIRVIQPNVGGAFGLKIPYFQEEPLVAALSLLAGRPVRWIAERREDLLAGGHAREGHFTWQAAFEDDGLVTALKVRYVADVGAPSALAGWGQAYVTGFALPTCYKIRDTDVEVVAVTTNKCPWNAYRGFGKESSSWLMDRVMDAVARETGRDRMAVRLRNFIPPDEFPYPQNGGAVIDSGNYPQALKRVLEMIDYANFPKLKAEARAQGRYIGLGIGQELTPEGCSIAGSARFNGWDGATVRISPTGEVTVLTGVTSPGTGNETALAQIAADQLGIDVKDVRVIQGDTSLCPYGLGNFSSRGVIMGGSAVHIAAGELREKLFKVAGRMLEAAPGDLETADGRIMLKGAPFRHVGTKDVVATIYGDCHGAAACGVEPGLEATRYFRHENVYHQPETQGRYSAYPSWANQSTALIAEVDPETGVVKILRYCAVHDSGKVINPMTAEGNVHGGTAQGIGGALFEHLVYDDCGQLTTTTFMDYTLPTALEVPHIELEHQETLSPFSPLGTKGVGESGVTSPLGALCGAVEDALCEFGVRIDRLPLSPENVWTALHPKGGRA
ncbi:MAG: xanthine dehydrogenase family protein molybdopterin-binding subunit [Gammaproteobacteria bacterium]|nr:xanthine dehydrogenase family protein molybdopterin-binding subunit [Gammaproteobacteria bacterium]